MRAQRVFFLSRFVKLEIGKVFVADHETETHACVAEQGEETDWFVENLAGALS